MTQTNALSDAFLSGAGQKPVSQYTCGECGYSSPNNKNFRKGDKEGTHVCSTGHYTDANGTPKRARNPYAR